MNGDNGGHGEDDLSQRRPIPGAFANLPIRWVNPLRAPPITHHTFVVGRGFLKAEA